VIFLLEAPGGMARDKECSGLFFTPKGHENLAQGLPWETRASGMSPEGAPAFRDVVPGRLVSGHPPGMSKRQRVECFRASGYKPKTQGKPWAKLS
jgi:hypothetical protein